jgi:Permuted papain-like amidase enzyme, YaeF/YiiX, C92 family
VRAAGEESADLEALLRVRSPQAAQSAGAPLEAGHVARVVEAISEGVSFTSLEHAAGGDSLVVLRPRLPKTARARAVARAFHYAGRPYDFDFDFRTDAALVCTELVAKAYEGDEELPGLDFPVVEVLGRPVTPANLIARQFDEDFGGEHQQFDMVAFLDGQEAGGNAVPAGIDAFRHSWRRPKWHVLVQNTPLAVR